MSYHIVVMDSVGRSYVAEKRFPNVAGLDAYLEEQEKEGYEVISVAESPEAAGCG